MSARPKRPVPRVALSQQEAADSLGVSLDHFQRHIAADLRLIRSGRLVLVSLKELERWCDENGALALDGGR